MILCAQETLTWHGCSGVAHSSSSSSSDNYTIWYHYKIHLFLTCVCMCLIIYVINQQEIELESPNLAQTLAIPPLWFSQFWPISSAAVGLQTAVLVTSTNKDEFLLLCELLCYCLLSVESAAYFGILYSSSRCYSWRGVDVHWPRSCLWWVTQRLGWGAHWIAQTPCRLPAGKLHCSAAVVFEYSVYHTFVHRLSIEVSEIQSL